jgi:DNA processing protein
LQLVLADGIGPITARELLSAFGDPQTALEAGQRAWRGVLSERQVQGLIKAHTEATELAQRTAAWLAQNPQRHHVVTLADAAYPSALLRTADPPLVLYAAGDLALLSQPALAMVGSRHPTRQGEQNAHAFAQALSEGGFTVVSGMALGIDAAAHEGALKGAGRTIAVVGTGVDRVYPKQNHHLAHQIAEKGLMLSEYPLGAPPLRTHFPRRNRLIAGLSHGTLVVEATLQSGSLITARLAAELGREVFAIPGSIHAVQSKGCHALIKQGAKLVEAAQDIFEELKNVPPNTSATLSAPTSLEHSAAPASASAPPSSPSPPPPMPEHPIVQTLGYEPMDLDTLCARTGLDAAALNAELLTLELIGQVTRLPGQRFQRLVRV